MSSLNFYVGSYYTFGMLMPGRKFEASDYNFGFNGKWRDDDLKGDGNLLDFGARLFDSRLGRWLSLDPLWKNYPNESPYLSTGNNPCFYIDKEGKVKITYLTIIINGQTITFKKVDQNFVKSVADDVRYKSMSDDQLVNVYHDHDVLENVVLNFDDPSKSFSSETDLGRTRSAAGEVAHSIGGLFKSFVDWQGGTGGIEWTSQIGGGEETRIADGDVRTENIDDILAAVEAGNGAASVEGGLFKLQKLKGNWAEKSNQIFSKASELLEAMDLSSEIGDAVRDILERAKNGSEGNNSKNEDTVITISVHKSMYSWSDKNNTVDVFQDTTVKKDEVKNVKTHVDQTNK